MKLTFIFALIISLIFGSTVNAVDGVIDDSSTNNGLPSETETMQTNGENPNVNSPNDITLTSDNSTSNASDINVSQSIESGSLDLSDTATTMTWPAIPGESMIDIARLFYPKNRIMRQQFIAETLALNADIEPTLKASNKFSEPTLLQIPTLKSLSQKVSVIQSKRAKANRQKMSLSYRLNESANKIPALLMQEYEALLAKNAFLKAELEKLQIRLGVLQDKLVNLKLIFDKTMRFSENTVPAESMPSTVAAETSSNIKIPDTESVVPTPQAKKVFKNLTQIPTADSNPVSSSVLTTQPESKVNTNPALHWLKYGLLAILSLMIVSSLIVYLMGKRREQLLKRLSAAIPKMDDTITDFGAQWQDTDPQSESQYTVEHQPNASANGFLNSEMRDQQSQATAALEEAKLLVSINRTPDAVVHLKSTIDAQPKFSINLCLYLLEIFRKQNEKEEFEQYAQILRHTFNVMTPVWYETNVAMVVSQQLEDFPHIIEKLTAVWPDELAKDYLEELITDNRNGERAGFSQAVMNEILMLIALLDTRRDFE